MARRYTTLALLGKKTVRKHHAFESLGSPIPGVADAIGLCWGLRISDKSPSDAVAAGAGRITSDCVLWMFKTVSVIAVYFL